MLLCASQTGEVEYLIHFLGIRVWIPKDTFKSTDCVLDNSSGAWRLNHEGSPSIDELVG